jgi:uncharacterized lipoprotein NlpE involved in copper resistance
LQYKKKGIEMIIIFYYYYISMKKLVLMGMLSSFLLLAACGNKTEVVDVDVAKTAALGECLADNGWTMYGTSTCPHCKNQKALFGSSFEEVTYIDCIAESQKCQIAGISGVPVWR